MTPFALFTIPHTGTRFIHSLLAGVPNVHLSEPQKGAYNFAHIIEKDFARIKEIAQQVRSIITLREPSKVYRSWYVHNHEPSSEQISFGDEKELERCWDRLIELDQYNPMYVTIDGEDRDAQLQAVGSEIGMPLLTDWKPVGMSHSQLDYTPNVPEHITRFYNLKK